MYDRSSTNNDPMITFYHIWDINVHAFWYVLPLKNKIINFVSSTDGLNYIVYLQTYFARCTCHCFYHKSTWVGFCFLYLHIFLNFTFARTNWRELFWRNFVGGILKAWWYVFVHASRIPWYVQHCIQNIKLRKYIQMWNDIRTNIASTVDVLLKFDMDIAYRNRYCCWCVHICTMCATFAHCCFACVFLHSMWCNYLLNCIFHVAFVVSHLVVFFELHPLCCMWCVGCLCCICGVAFVVLFGNNFVVLHPWCFCVVMFLMC